MKLPTSSQETETFTSFLDLNQRCWSQGRI